MKYIASTLCILFLLCGNAYAFDKWTPQQKQLEIANQVLMAMDWSQTRYISDNPTRFKEVGCFGLIGEHPNRYQVDTYFAAYALSHLVITHVLPSKYRNKWQVGTLCMSASVIVGNNNIGIKFVF